jgi:intracellular sulfur oxidation DsrE/DsrF family protein
MKKTLRLMAAMLSAILFLATPAAANHETDGINSLAIQISDNDPATFNKALNVAANFARMQSEAGNLYQIEIVTFNAGLHLLREDTSPVMDRVKSMSASIPDLQFSACGNTINGMTKNEGKAPPIFEGATVVPGGVGRLMTLDHEGWYVIRP